MTALACTASICAALVVLTWLGLRFAREAECPRPVALRPDLAKAVKRYMRTADAFEEEAAKNEVIDCPLTAQSRRRRASELRKLAEEAQKRGRLP